jgi:hypothetical protein
MDIVREEEYRKNIEAYANLYKQKKAIEAELDVIKETIAVKMHEDKVNEIVVTISDDESWKAAYQSSSRSSTDLKMLMEYVGPQRYAEIVTVNESTFLTIRKSGKKKKSSFVNTKPAEEIMPVIPDGIILG